MHALDSARFVISWLYGLWRTANNLERASLLSGLYLLALSALALAWSRTFADLLPSLAWLLLLAVMICGQAASIKAREAAA